MIILFFSLFFLFFYPRINKNPIFAGLRVDYALKRKKKQLDKLNTEGLQTIE